MQDEEKLNGGSDGLTVKQSPFVAHYTGEALGNGVEAARMAGYEGDENTLAATASRLLRNVKVSARVKERLKELTLTSDQVLAQPSEIAFAEWRDFVQVRMDKTGKVVDARLVLWDQMRALEILGKYHGLFQENRKNDVDVGRETRLSEFNRKWAQKQREECRKDYPNITEEELDELLRTLAPDVYKYLM